MKVQGRSGILIQPEIVLVISGGSPVLLGIETSMHDRLSDCRVNEVNRRREFFRATPSKVKAHLDQLAGQLEFREIAEAIEYRQSLRMRTVTGESAASEVAT
ncbi:hypothetical protein CWO91_39240 [Bradyrhizobium genosp. SA-3]|nr:hypothetical protein CWO91_39240 [Bradyrhizobium genosp. SA-3]